MKGYKVFNPDWTCRGFQYAVGETYERSPNISVCERGFHFCERAADCFNFYSFDPKNKVAEVEALGTVLTEGDKSCTDKIKIVRELTWEEVLRLVNTGLSCTGLQNSGNRNSGNGNSGNGNSGDGNSGDWNSGDWNSGDWNSGDWNSGNGNSGNWNSGDWNSGNGNSGNGNSGNGNSGDWNSGNWNSGNGNSGNWNKTDFSNGCFNTFEPKIYMFNRPTDWTYRDWINSEAFDLFRRIDDRPLIWIDFCDMTEEEKAAHKEAETTGGYLKKVDTSDCVRVWWAKLTKSEKAVIKALPNFDAKIFKEITGIEVEE